LAQITERYIITLKYIYLKRHGANSYCDCPHSAMSLLFAFVRIRVEDASNNSYALVM